MASEIAGLAPLRAFIKQENRVVPVRFRLGKQRGRQPEFIERKMPEPEPKVTPPQVAASPVVAPIAKPKAVPQVPASVSTAAPAAEQKPIAVQKELPLAPAVAKVPEPAFV